MNHEDIEARLRKAKAKREKLLNLRAERLAAQKAAQEKLEKLREKAAKHGFDLESLPDIVAKKRREVEQKVTELEEALSSAEQALSKYDDQE